MLDDHSSNLLTSNLISSIEFSISKKTLKLADANLSFEQLNLLIAALRSLNSLNASIDFEYANKISQLEIRGLNLNGNSDLDDRALKKIHNYAIENQKLRVLQLERFKVTHVSLIGFFEGLHMTNIRELNLSSIPLNYHLVESLCFNFEKNKVELKTLELRNSKLTDLAALKLMESLLGVRSRPLKISRLNLSTNNKLGFKFQNELVKMLEE